ncbi:hypothetical protein [Chimaeribacter arupi]|nr:hypothetical protein [Chimaeribacter arupi]
MPEWPVHHYFGTLHAAWRRVLSIGANHNFILVRRVWPGGRQGD